MHQTGASQVDPPQQASSPKVGGEETVEQTLTALFAARALQHIGPSGKEGKEHICGHCPFT
eukprot:4026473-Lingulodinium_polyedra.AAC.1